MSQNADQSTENIDLDKQVKSMIQDFLHLFYTDESYQAYEIVKKFKNDSILSQHQLVKDFLYQCREALMLQEEIQAVGEFLKELETVQKDSESKKHLWLKYSDLPHEKIYYRQDEGTKFHTNYIETLVQAPILDVVSVLADVEQYRTWVSVITHSKLLSEASSLRKLTCLRADLPKPMSKRQLVVQASGHFLYDQQALVVSISSVNPEAKKWLKDYHLQKSLFKETRSLVNMKVPKSFVYIKAISPTKTQVKMLLSGDPRLDFVPQTLINWTVKSVVMTFISSMKQKAEGKRKGSKKITEVSVDQSKVQFMKDIEEKIQRMKIEGPKL
ncbi:hypothetical protein FGO68_gene12566 [Halteria grandinella]|uniref:START domain-containing protein n=1 Tax=Halteria grandinella TaxID=5974 RepID=A0A8J8NX54_HALGN|nr:hypothetical protein FGO68_gene12566 [Halteria grandinella]